jgi:hypothetical protein
MTASGALFTAYFLSHANYPTAVIGFAGLWLSFVFVVCEVVLSFTMACQNKVAREKVGNSHKEAFKHRHWLALWSIRILMPSVYVIVGAYWAFLSIQKICLPA